MTDSHRNPDATTEREAASVDDTAAIVGVSPAMIWKLIRLGKIKPIRIGRRTLITATERRRFLAAA